MGVLISVWLLALVFEGFTEMKTAKEVFLSLLGITVFVFIVLNPKL